MIPCLVPPIITLTTDFGLRDAYVGVMRGVILGIEPRARVVDISHAVEPQNILAASFLLLSAYPYFPHDAIHVAVVDPGVGTARKPIAVRTPHGTFVGPDNGLFAPVLRRQGKTEEDGLLDSAIEAVELVNPAYRLPETSSTFHGRDIFAPAAAYLSRGVPLSELGRSLASIQFNSFPEPTGDSRHLVGEIVYIDHFGNAVSNISAAQVPAGAVICVGSREIGHLAENYQAAPITAVIGSTGLVEIAARNASAQAELHLHVGDPVRALLP